jgi:hydrogenase nickel incorporation protein HypB
MCTICGCSPLTAPREHGCQDPTSLRFRAAPDGHDHTHGNAHDHGALYLEPGAAAGPEGARLLQVERDLLATNDAWAARNRRHFAEHGIFALNLVSSPGAGKTTLLCRTIERLAGRLPLAVIEGDQQTSHDAERIRATGAPAIQINTGRGCHLDARMVSHALERLSAPQDSVLFIENVGNLVCPAGFDLGEAHKIVILSVTEGEDKPLKYPDMFRAADVMVLSKTDLLPHLNFDVDRCLGYAHRVNPALRIIRASVVNGDGLDEWLAWIGSGAALIRNARAQHAIR